MGLEILHFLCNSETTQEGTSLEFIVSTKKSNLPSQHEIKQNIARPSYWRELKKKYHSEDSKEKATLLLQHRKKDLQSTSLEVILGKGIPEFKQVQLYKNYRRFVPPLYQNDKLYDKPSDEILNRVKDDTKEKKTRRKIEKERKNQIDKSVLTT